MIIRSQDKSIIVDAFLVHIDDVLSKKTQKRTISAQYSYSGITAGFTAGCIIGTYPDTDTAMKEMDNIMNFFNVNTSLSSIYQMK
jgi:hypothetical protein